jgi:hypothetical protein
VTRRLRNPGLAMVLAAALVGPGVAGFGTGRLNAAEPRWPAAAISADLAGEAPAVLRELRTQFRVDDADRATLTVRRVVTILRRAGQDYGFSGVAYDSFRRVVRFEARLFNASGEELRRLDSRDVSDFSAIAGFSLFEDVRVKAGGLVHTSFPYTVAIEYQVELNGLMNWPEWAPLEEGLPVERASLLVSLPETMPFRVVSENLAGATADTVEDRRRIVRWSLRGLRPAPEVSGAVGAGGAPRVLLAPIRFRLGGREGSLASWEEFGRWHFDLWRDRRTLPEAYRARVQALAGDGVDPREAARRLYRHLQANYRYVSVQLGIGGWQPHAAEDVVRTGYGDCKGLVNLMAASLDVVGIESRPALVRAGDSAPDIRADFPSNQFNHVILCVPVDGDTLWFECTSRSELPGRLGPFTEDRHVLLLGPGGGELRRTPLTPAEGNRRERRIIVRLEESGDARIDLDCAGAGVHRDRLLAGLGEGPGEAAERWLLEALDQVDARITGSDLSALHGDSSDVRFSCTADARALASRTGQRLFLKPIVLDRWAPLPATFGRELETVYFRSTTDEVDTFLVALPSGFGPESLPAPVKLEAPFGSYEVTVGLERGDRVLRLVRRLVINRRRVEGAERAALVEFVAGAARGDNAEMVLVKAR